MRPTGVRVLGQPFTFEFHEHDDTTLSLEGHAMGRTDIRHQRILINADQAETQLRDTGLHEVIHACLHVQELGAEDEEFVRRLAPVLLDVLRSNPVLVAWLTQ